MVRLVHGLGICRKGIYPAIVMRKPTKLYTLWANMIKRCTDALQGPYTGCICHPEFVEYQKFAEWCHTQIGFGMDGYQLDKDILIPGNKVYGPDTCVFVPQHLNLLLINNISKTGMPIGVTFVPRDNRYKARLSVHGVQKNLGHFDSPDDAHEAYRTAKLGYIRDMAEFYKSSIDHRVYDALLNYQVRDR